MKSTHSCRESAANYCVNLSHDISFLTIQYKRVTQCGVAEWGTAQPGVLALSHHCCHCWEGGESKSGEEQGVGMGRRWEQEGDSGGGQEQRGKLAKFQRDV